MLTAKPITVEEGSMAEHFEWVNHKGKRVLIVRFSGIKEEKPYLEAIDALEREILRQPRGQFIPLVMDVSDTRVTKGVTDKAKKMMATFKEKGVLDSPTALVGLSGAQKAIVMAIQILRPDLHVAGNMDDAKDWVVKQLK
jgi:hypothetical protein